MKKFLTAAVALSFMTNSVTFAAPDEKETINQKGVEFFLTESLVTKFY